MNPDALYMCVGETEAKISTGTSQTLKAEVFKQEGEFSTKLAVNPPRCFSCSYS